ncbi:MAG: hypothetical protein HYV40_02845 [Candidatus Levybacteria bacterium]|nr:hypothetical protein [Candidatus Levybacteria bacterium]
MIKFLLDSGDPDEYREIAALVKERGKARLPTPGTGGQELWGATTNPTLIAKKLTGQKITRDEAFALQKKIVLEILDIVEGAVSAEVYADTNTQADEMISQGKEIAAWHDRIVVKLPTTIEGFKARTELRRNGFLTNNTLVFSQQQIFAICLHEQIVRKEFSLEEPLWPPFISPFVGRLDDIGLQGMLVTAPAKVYRDYFQGIQASTKEIRLQPIPYWEPSEELLKIETVDGFMEAITSGKLDLHHDLTDKGIIRFSDDWNSLMSS